MVAATKTASKRAVSFSALEKYHNCPRQYYRTSIKKDIPFIETPQMQEGKRVHKALENLMKFNRALPPDLAYLTPVMEKFVDTRIKPGYEILCELQLALTADFKMVKWFSKDTWYRSIIDLAILGDKTAVMVDYKTGKRKRNPDYKQLEQQAAALSVIRPHIEVFKTALMWTSAKGAMDTHVVHKAEIPGIWEQIYQEEYPLQESVKTGVFHPTPSGLCNGWCPVKDCEYWKPMEKK